MKMSNCLQPEFTINLVSNSSMKTFSNNTLANFTTLLPNVIELPRANGDYWQVALFEISWPAKFKNITQGLFRAELDCDGDRHERGSFSSDKDEE